MIRHAFLQRSENAGISGNVLKDTSRHTRKHYIQSICLSSLVLHCLRMTFAPSATRQRVSAVKKACVFLWKKTRENLQRKSVISRRPDSKIKRVDNISSFFYNKKSKDRHEFSCLSVLSSVIICACQPFVVMFCCLFFFAFFIKLSNRSVVNPCLFHKSLDILQFTFKPFIFFCKFCSIVL